MRRSLPALCLAAALAPAFACTPPAPAKSEGEGEEAAKKAEKTEDTEKAEAPKPEPPPEPDGATRESEPPPWYDEKLYPVVKVVRQDQSETKFAGGYASAMVLELEADTSPEVCMKTALGEIRKDLDEGVEVPAPAAGPDGRLTVTGNGTGYEYVVVCGIAKGKSTLYLSYTRS